MRVERSHWETDKIEKLHVDAFPFQIKICKILEKLVPEFTFTYPTTRLEDSDTRNRFDCRMHPKTHPDRSLKIELETGISDTERVKWKKKLPKEFWWDGPHVLSRKMETAKAWDVFIKFNWWLDSFFSVTEDFVRTNSTYAMLDGEDAFKDIATNKGYYAIPWDLCRTDGLGMTYDDLKRLKYMLVTEWEKKFWRELLKGV